MFWTEWSCHKQKDSVGTMIRLKNKTAVSVAYCRQRFALKGAEFFYIVLTYVRHPVWTVSLYC